MSLSKAEEQIMEVIWHKNPTPFKEIMSVIPEPKPANTTLATLLKRIQEKGFIDFHLKGNLREYYPLVKKEDYFKNHVDDLINNFFAGNPLQFASFFTQNSNLSQKQLEELKSIIEQKIEK